MVQGFPSWAFQVDTTDLCCLCNTMMMMITIRMMEVVVTAGAIKRAKLQSNCHRRLVIFYSKCAAYKSTYLLSYSSKPISSFFTGQCPSSCPTNTVRALLESALKQNLFYSLPCTIYNVWNFSLLVLCACNYDHLSSFDDNTLLDM